MNHKAQTAVIIVLVLLVVMFGVGMFFAGPVNVPVNPAVSSSVQGGEGAASTTTAPATQIVQYEPDQPASSTPVQQGSCWTNSISAPFRGDAWRCTVGDSISDPCFQIPGSQNLLCGADPVNPASSSTFILSLTSPLPQSQPIQGLQPADSVWRLELQGGTVCSPFTGTLPVTADGESPSYGCAPGPLGREVYVFNINTASSAWIATVGTLQASTSNLPTIANATSVPVAEVWK